MRIINVCLPDKISSELDGSQKVELSRSEVIHQDFDHVFAYS